MIPRPDNSTPCQTARTAEIYLLVPTQAQPMLMQRPELTHARRRSRVVSHNERPRTIQSAALGLPVT